MRRCLTNFGVVLLILKADLPETPANELTDNLPEWATNSVWYPGASYSSGTVITVLDSLVVMDSFGELTVFDRNCMVNPGDVKEGYINLPSDWTPSS